MSPTKKAENKRDDGHLEKIVVKGARTHNLKNITVEMPRHKMIVMTGLSGSGKSSLAFDTIFAEGQRRYVESLSAYARQFLNQMQKPDVDEISGLSPAISIDQKSAGRNPRSTVATITEIYDYLRVLYARVGKPYCVDCGSKIQKLSNEEIINFITDKVKAVDYKKVKTELMGVPFSHEEVHILAPMVRGRKGEYYQMLYDFLGKGYTEALVDGERKSLREQIILDKNKKHEISIIIDSIAIDDFRRKESQKDALTRLSEGIERALHETEGLLEVEIVGERTIMSGKFMCAKCGFSFPEIEPRLFSFNSPYGACPGCNGLGVIGFFHHETCPECEGKRLRKEALNVFIGGSSDTEANAKGERGINIVDYTALSIKDARAFLDELMLTDKERDISKLLLREVENRLQFMLDVGIEYLTLDRRATTLSGGEAQRIRLASQLGSGLVGALTGRPEACQVEPPQVGELLEQDVAPDRL
jgi:excinuclease ABC subunit A